MIVFNRQPAAVAMGLALVALAAAVSAEEAKPETAAPMGQHACHTGKVDAMTGGHGNARQVEPAAAPAVGSGKGDKQSGPSGGRPTPAGAASPDNDSIAAEPHAHLTVSGSDRVAAMPCVSGTLPADPSGAKGKAHKTRSNIQNN